MNDVAAIVIGTQPDRVRAIAEREAVAVAEAATLAGVPALAARVDAPLLWLVESGATPAAGALAALREPGRTPAVSLPVDADGAPVEEVLGRFTDDTAGVIDAVSRGRVPLRHTHVLSMLVRRDAVLEQRPPDVARLGRYAGSEWTARLFAAEPGMLVPSSTVRVGDVSPGAPLDAIRMARTGVWRRGETLRELHRSAFAARRRARG
jgi:hypothetical protein